MKPLTLRGSAGVERRDWSSGGRRELLPHQYDALEWARCRREVALFMEMRLGKTLVSIRWAEMRGCQKILVLAPLSTLAGWRDELQAEGYGPESVRTALGAPKARLEAAEGAPAPGGRLWVLLNYEGLRALPVLATFGWDCVIADESTRFRNPQAKTTRVLINMFGNVAHRAILSGMPAPEGPLDYFSQMHFLHGEFMQCRNYWEFRNRYFRRLGWDWVPHRGVLARIKEEAHDQSFVLTRKQAGLGSRKIYERRVIAMEPLQKKMMRDISKNFAVDPLTGERLETKWVVAKLSWMHRLAGGFDPNEELVSSAKFDELVSLLKGELTGEQTVIWFRYLAEMKEAEKRLRAINRTPGIINGSVRVEDRHELRNQFKDGKLTDLLVQVKCGRFGLDLSASSTAIYFSNAWDGEDRAQSEDRIVHPQKNEPLLYIDLVMKDTIDEDVVELLREKKLNASMFMNKLIERQLARGTA